MSEKKEIPSYHDLHITTKNIKRTSIFNLPFNVYVNCTRASGWQAWRSKRIGEDEYLGGEYGYDAEEKEGEWLILDINGYVICDSSPKE